MHACSKLNVFRDLILCVDLPGIDSGLQTTFVHFCELADLEASAGADHDVGACDVALAGSKSVGHLGKHEVGIGRVEAVWEDEVVEPLQTCRWC